MKVIPEYVSFDWDHIHTDTAKAPVVSHLRSARVGAMAGDALIEVNVEIVAEVADQIVALLEDTVRRELKLLAGDEDGWKINPNQF